MSADLFDNVTITEIPKLDPKHNFTFEEKLLYHRAGGKCQLEHKGKVCGRSIDFEDAVVDHIKSHSLDGKTSYLTDELLIDNSCNIACGNRNNFNPEKDCHLDED